MLHFAWPKQGPATGPRPLLAKLPFISGMSQKKNQIFDDPCSVGGDISIDYETPVVISSNIPAQSLKSAHRGKVYVCVHRDECMHTDGARKSKWTGARAAKLAWRGPDQRNTKLIHCFSRNTQCRSGNICMFAWTLVGTPCLRHCVCMYIRESASVPCSKKDH